MEPGSSLQAEAPGTKRAVPEMSGGQRSCVRRGMAISQGGADADAGSATQARESSDTSGEQEGWLMGEARTRLGKSPGVKG